MKTLVRKIDSDIFTTFFIYHLLPVFLPYFKLIAINIDSERLILFDIPFALFSSPSAFPAYIHSCIQTYMQARKHASMHSHIHACMCTCIHACMHAYIHTYMHSYTHTYMLAFMHTYIHACMHACIHTYIHAYMHSYTHTSMLACMHAYIHTCIHTCTGLQSWFRIFQQLTVNVHIFFPLPGLVFISFFLPFFISSTFIIVSLFFTFYVHPFSCRRHLLSSWHCLYMAFILIYVVINVGHL